MNPDASPNPPSLPPAKQRSFLAAAAHYMAAATSLPAAIIAGYLIGYGLDYWLHTTFLKIVFLILGIIAGFMDIVRQLLRDMNKK
ncbi:MAG: AtpZ/AtpI family protein [Bryobacteraceae bacterium]